MLSPEHREALREELDNAVAAYHGELSLLTRYSKKSRERELLRRFAAGKVPVGALPHDLRSEVEGRPAASLAPAGMEIVRDGKDRPEYPVAPLEIRGEWEVLRALGAPAEAMDLARRYASGLPSSYPPTALAVKRRRAGELLRTPFSMRRRMRPREQAERHLAANLAELWWAVVTALIETARKLGSPNDDELLRALRATVCLDDMMGLSKPPSGGGRPDDKFPDRRAAFIKAVFAANRLPAPSSATLAALPRPEPPANTF
jgi:hypothetical protein